ncbi:apolipoprotein N-acyltransferase [Streptomyces sp. NPDC049954]|uniref:apolipoprotein N-acyltransferase n=1 Tax=Streptomyces sp. NPDC049954 TaxID=3155779 RepID=UPI003437FD92
MGRVVQRRADREERAAGAARAARAAGRASGAGVGGARAIRPGEGRGPAAPLDSPWWRGAAAVLAGALPALAFPAPALWWWAYGALVPWLLLAARAPTARRAMLDGWLGGLGYMLAVHHWLLPSLHVFTLLLAALLGVLWAPFGFLARRLLGGAPGPGRAAAALLLLPSAWLVPELVRSWQGLGGPWGLLGSSQWQVGPALRLASVGGVWLVGLAVVAVNTAGALLLRAPGARTLALGGLLAVGVLTASVSWWAPRPQPAGSARIAYVQPGVIPGVVPRLEREETLTRTLVSRRPDLVVWGESSVGADLTRRPGLARRLAALSRRVGADLLVNVDARRADRPGIYKSAVLIGADGPTGARYDKRRLVPFGEYVPARALLGWATSVGKAAGEDRMRGNRQVVMEVPRARGTDGGPLRIGPLICFETAFPDLSRRLVRDGAQVVVAQSSTSTFQDSWAPAQHASLGALRAAETGRPVVHATLTGVSAAFGPDGERLGPWLGTDRSALAVREVPLATGRTLYVRLGDWPVTLALGSLAVYGGLAAGRRLGGRAGASAAADAP